MAVSGSTWIDESKLFYIDENGTERSAGGIKGNIKEGIAGSIWLDNQIKFLDANKNEITISHGTPERAIGAIAGSIWIEGNAIWISPRTNTKAKIQGTSGIQITTNISASSATVSASIIKTRLINITANMVAQAANVIASINHRPLVRIIANISASSATVSARLSNNIKITANMIAQAATVSALLEKFQIHTMFANIIAGRIDISATLERVRRIFRPNTNVNVMGARMSATLEVIKAPPPPKTHTLRTNINIRFARGIISTRILHRTRPLPSSYTISESSATPTMIFITFAGSSADHRYLIEYRRRGSRRWLIGNIVRGPAPIGVGGLTRSTIYELRMRRITPVSTNWSNTLLTSTTDN